MKPVIIELLLGAISLLTAAAQPTNPIQQLPLNPLVVARIPVALTGPTTIRFPSPISDLEGASISTDPNSSAHFLLSFHSGASFFSMRALVANTNAFMNVVWKDQTYVLEFEESKTPWRSLVLTEIPSPPAPASRQAVTQALTPSRLLGFLDTAKAFPLLKTQQPAGLTGIECVRPDTVNDYGDYSIRTEEVFRFDHADTLVFRIAVSNKTARVMRYLPQSFMVQTGRRVFYQSITDGSGEVPPQTSVPVYFAVTGTAEGGRNDLSPRNDFLVLLHRLDPESSAATTGAPGPAAQRPLVPPLTINQSRRFPPQVH